GAESTAQLSLAGQHPRTEEPGATVVDAEGRGGNQPRGNRARTVGADAGQRTAGETGSAGIAITRGPRAVREGVFAAAAAPLQWESRAAGQTCGHGTYAFVSQASVVGGGFQEYY